MLYTLMARREADSQGGDQVETPSAERVERNLSQIPAAVLRRAG